MKWRYDFLSAIVVGEMLEIRATLVYDLCIPDESISSNSLESALHAP